eukprot:249425-Chlamydomonas_euryale.AAC.3
MRKGEPRRCSRRRAAIPGGWRGEGRRQRGAAADGAGQPLCCPINCKTPQWAYLTARRCSPRDSSPHGSAAAAPHRMTTRPCVEDNMAARRGLGLGCVLPC